jgi:hypothetical protein
VRYQFIKEQHGRFPVAVLCRALQVSQSGYFAWLRRTPSRRSREETHLLVQIRAVYQQSDKSYGSPRIQRDLAAQGVVCSRWSSPHQLGPAGALVPPVKTTGGTDESGTVHQRADRSHPSGGRQGRETNSGPV